MKNKKKRRTQKAKSPSPPAKSTRKSSKLSSQKVSPLRLTRRVLTENEGIRRRNEGFDVDVEDPRSYRERQDSYNESIDFENDPGRFEN